MKKSLLTLGVLSSLAMTSFSFADTPTTVLPHMSAAALQKNNGQNGQKSYVALNGYVYDVSNVEQWKGGKHYKGMKAGTDLTPNISKSPHGPDIVHDLNLKPVAVYP